MRWVRESVRASNRGASQTRSALSTRSPVTVYRGEGGLVVRAKLIRQLSPREVRSQRIFIIPRRSATVTATERQVGSRPAHGGPAYWFGPSVAGRLAVTVVEHQSLANVAPRKDVSAYIVFYERPSVGKRTSAQPGQAPPEGELQVISRSITEPAAQGALDAFNGVTGDVHYKPWPRFSVRLPDGRSAVAVVEAGDRGVPDPVTPSAQISGFSVLTDDALISIVGEMTVAEARVIAEGLVRVR
jgi:hypothetical protein